MAQEAFKGVLPISSSSGAQPEHKPEAPALQEHPPQAQAQAGSTSSDDSSNKRKREDHQQNTSRGALEHKPVRAVAPAPQEHQPQRALALAQAPRGTVPEDSSFAMSLGEWDNFKRRCGEENILNKLCKRTPANFDTEEEQQQYAVQLVSFLLYEGPLPREPTQKQKERVAARKVKDRAK